MLPALLRPGIYLLIITLVINTIGWTFNNEAIADVWFNDQACQSAQAADATDQQQAFNKMPAKSPCNHWCYTVGHFLGLLSPVQFNTLEFATAYLNPQPDTIQFSAPDGRFRPPQHHS